MTAITPNAIDPTGQPPPAGPQGGAGASTFPGAAAAAGDSVWRRAGRSGRIVVGGAVLLLIAMAGVLTLPWTLDGGGETATGQTEEASQLYFDKQNPDASRQPPSASSAIYWFGTDGLGRSLLARCLLGGAISLSIGVAAAMISIVLGVSVGLFAGYRGGWVDAVLMRTVDIMYGLPYVLLVILLKIALEGPMVSLFGSRYVANLFVLFFAIGAVSWLTMARVIRGQVLSLRAQPFIEACRAGGLTEWRIFTRHLLPNLVGPITVYATLTIPQAILQESFLSFLGIGIQPPLPTWGWLASDGLLPGLNKVNPRWWMLLFPCTLLAVTLLSLNFLGDGLRDLFDPKREAAKI